MNKLKPLTCSIRHALCCSLTICLFPLTAADAREVTFSTDILKARGISTSVAQYFANEARFLPGRHAVSLKVNGTEKGTLALRFGDKGQLCVDNDFTDAAGLRTLSISASETCHEIHSDYPDATLNYRPNDETVELFVPTVALDNDFYTQENYATGGTAGLLNYTVFNSHNEFDTASNDYSQADLEAGMNIADWTLRSRYIVTDDNGERNADSLYTFAEHVFMQQKIRAQVGQINVQSALFSGAPISGVQIQPEQGLISNFSGVSVSGIARTQQARVEVRQSGQLIYSSVVQAGPFTLENVPIVRHNADLDVSVVETDNSVTRFIIPAASFRRNGLSRPTGLTMSLGKVRDVEGDYSNPWVYNVSDGWLLHPQLSLQASGVAAQDYQAAGTMLDWAVNDSWTLSSSLLGSRESFGSAQNGMKTELQSNLYLTSNFALSLNAAHYSNGYRELTEALDDEFERSKNSWGGNLSWSAPLVGTFSLGYNYEQASDSDTEDSRYMIASWSKSFQYGSVSVNWQHALNSHISDDNGSRYNDDDMVYVNLSIPLGANQNISAYMRDQGDRTAYGVQNSGIIGRNTNYYLAVERESAERDVNSLSGGLSTNLHYTQLSLAATADSDRQRTYNGTLSGGVAIHDHGLTFSPYAIKNTFGIARLSESQSGVEISTPQGSVWTDVWGQAVIPGVSEWRKSRIEINANSLPQNMDLANGIKSVVAAHGSVSKVDFNVLNTRRVMLTVKGADGQWLPKGMSIVDEHDNYQVSVVDSGRVFISDVEGNPALYAVDDNMQRICRIHYTLSDEQDKEAFYETVEGTCQ